MLLDFGALASNTFSISENTFDGHHCHLFHHHDHHDHHHPPHHTVHHDHLLHGVIVQVLGHSVQHKEVRRPKHDVGRDLPENER